MPELRIQTLGAFKIWRHDEAAPDDAWPSHKARTLFKILLTHRGRFVAADRLIDYLWPDADPDRARSNLWVTAGRLRHTLQPELAPRAPSAYILTDREGYMFNTDANYWLDVEALDGYLKTARETQAATERIEALEIARRLYRGDYLAEDLYEEWSLAAREHWREAFHNLMADLAGEYAQQGRYRRAIAICQASLGLDNLRESVYRQQMLYHYLAGEQSQALRLYESCRSTLENELGVAPMPETVALFNQILRREVSAVDDEIVYPAPVRTLSPVYSLGRTPFVGRAREYAHLATLADLAAASRGQIALVTGEPGVGKTRLLQELAGLVRERGGQTLLASCYEFGRRTPYLPIIQLIEQLIDAGPPGEAPLPPAEALAELALLVPELARLRPGIPGHAGSLDEAWRHRLFKGLRQLLVAFAVNRRLMLVVDDIHWADPTSLEALHFLGQSIADTAILLALAYRSEVEATDPEIGALVHSLRRQPYVHLVRVPRLSSEDVAALLAAMPRTFGTLDLGPWLYHETDGNPFFMVTILQSLLEDRMGLETDPAGESATGRPVMSQPLRALPDTLLASVRERLRRLPENARRLMEVASVLGRPFDMITLEAVIDGGEGDREDLLDTLDGLLKRQLFQEGESGAAYDFSHPKIREVVYHDLSGARRISLHHRIAQGLETLYGERRETIAALLAEHYRRARMPKPAIAYARGAAEQALRVHAYEEARAQLGQALDMLPDNERPEERLAVLEQLGDVCSLAGENSAAIPLYQEALGRLPSGSGVDALSRLRLHRKVLGSVRDLKWQAGYDRYEQLAEAAETSRAYLAEAWQNRPDDAPHAEQVRMLMSLAEDARIVRAPPDPVTEERYAAAAVAQAGRLGEPVLLSAALGTAALAYHARGMILERWQLARQRLELLADPGFDDDRERAEALVEAGSVLAQLGRFDEALSYLSRAEGLGDLIRHGGLQVSAILLQSHCLFALDRWDDLLALSQKLTDLGQKFPPEQLGSTCFTVALEATILGLRGNSEAATALQEKAYTMMADLSGTPEQWARNQHY